MTDKPRYSRISDILDLATFMQSKPLGITINDIISRYGVSRRTAERMRDSLLVIFPSIDEIETDDIQKHWGFTNCTINNLISFTTKELANIEQLQRRTTNKELKDELGKTVEKIKALSRKNKIPIETNIELYMQTEGYAVRQTPQHKIDIKSVDIIREAIQNSKKVTAIYHDKKRLLEPLGLIYGEKLYLIAKEEKKGKEIYSYIFHKLDSILITDKTFDRKDFNLQEYVNLSFGIYHGEILNVKLSFDKELAQSAKEYNFHPTQKIKEEKDGKVTVTFKASGSREIIWHVFKWGAGCKIAAPKELQEEYKKYLEENLKNY